METSMIVLLLSLQVIYPRIQINLNSPFVHLQILLLDQYVQSWKYIFQKAVLPFSPYTLVAFLATRCIERSSLFSAPPLPAHIPSPCPSIPFTQRPGSGCSAGLANLSYIPSPVSDSTFAVVLDQTWAEKYHLAQPFAFHRRKLT